MFDDSFNPSNQRFDNRDALCTIIVRIACYFEFGHNTQNAPSQKQTIICPYNNYNYINIQLTNHMLGFEIYN